MSFIFLLGYLILLISAGGTLIASDISPIPYTNPYVGAKNSYAVFNPAFLTRQEQSDTITDSEKANIISIESGIGIGYLGISELNPKYISAVLNTVDYGFGVRLGGLTHRTFNDYSLSAVGCYKLTNELSFGSSYTYSYFQPIGYEILDRHNIGMSLKVSTENSFIYIIIDDIMDSKRMDRDAESSLGRQLVGGYVYARDDFSVGLDFQVSEARGGIIPSVSLALIDSFQLFARGHSITRSFSTGFNLEYNFIYLSSELIYSDRIGIDFVLCIGLYI